LYFSLLFLKQKCIFVSEFGCQMRKELGKVLIDIAKLVIGGVILAG